MMWWIQLLLSNVRWLLLAPLVALAPAAVTPAFTLLGTTSVQAASVAKSAPALGARRGAPTSGGNAFKGSSALPDTCTYTDHWGLCDLDEFIARCDAAGGGLSSLPGGGVDCDTSGW
jgi:hypothetical protein